MKNQKLRKMTIALSVVFAALTLTACAEDIPTPAAAEYTVVYNKNAPAGTTVTGTTANSSHTYDVSGALTANGFVLDGWDFLGWAASESGEVSYADGASVKNLTAVNGATVNLYAVWGFIDLSLIKTPEQLANIDMDGEYRLGADLSLDGFTPLGSAENPFTGSLNGNGFKISLLQINLDTFTADGQGNIYAGMFSVNAGKVENLVIENLAISGNSQTDGSSLYAGAIAGLNEGDIENCTVQGDIDADAGTSNAKYRLGLVSGKSTGSIIGSATTGSIKAKLDSGNSRIGGLAGTVAGGSVFQSAARVDIDAQANSETIVAGGLIGLVDEKTAYISQCYAAGNVKSTGVSATVYADGLIGQIEAKAAENLANFFVESCYAAGDAYCVTAGNSYAGGLIARIENAGYITEILIADCYCAGLVTNNATGGNVYAAGLIGRIQMQNTSVMEIINCFTASSLAYAKSGADISSIKNSNGSNNVGNTTNCYYIEGVDFPAGKVLHGAETALESLTSNTWQQANLDWQFNLWVLSNQNLPHLAWEV